MVIVVVVFEGWTTNAGGGAGGGGRCLVFSGGWHLGERCSVKYDSFWKGSRRTKDCERYVSGVFVGVGQQLLRPVSR